MGKRRLSVVNGGHQGRRKYQMEFVAVKIANGRY